MIVAQQSNSSWLIYIGAVLLYTALTFRGELPPGEASIFSKDNARPPTSVLTIHAVFLGGLLAAIWMAIDSLPVLPSWLTATFTFHEMPMSVLELGFILGGFAMHYIERRMLYVGVDKSGIDHSYAADL